MATSKYLADFNDNDKLAIFYRAVENAFVLVQDDNKLTIKQYNQTVIYTINEIVIFNNKFWQAISNTTGVFNTDDWVELPFSGGGGGTGDMTKAVYDTTNKQLDVYTYTDNAVNVVQLQINSIDNRLTITEGDIETIGDAVIALNTDFYNKMNIMQTPTGFANNDEVVCQYDSVTRTITLTGNVEAYYEGVLIPELVSGWVSPAHPDVVGNYFLFHNGTGFEWSTAPWLFSDIMIAYVQYQTAFKFGVKETHGVVMDPSTHEQLHETIGTYRHAGLNLVNYVLSSTTAVNRRPDVETGEVKDEDNITALRSLTSKLYTHRFLSGASVRNLTINNAEIVPVSGNQPYYNLNTGGVWSQALMSNNNYQAIFLVGVPTTSDANSEKFRFMWVQGQTQSATLANIKAITPQDLVHGDIAGLVSEFVFLAKIIIQYTGGNWTITSVENLTGTRNNTTSAPAGTYLSSVSHDASLSGDGTLTTPLTVVKNFYTEAEANALLNAKANTADVYTKTESNTNLSNHDLALISHLNDYNNSRTGKDANGIFVTVEFRRTDGTLFLKSVLSGGTSPKYTTKTITKYATNGTTVLSTSVYTLTYDVDGDLLSEVKN